MQATNYNPDPLLDDKETSEYIHSSPGTLANQRNMRTGPTYVKIGRLVRYRKSDLDAYIESGVVQPGVASAA